MSLSTKAGTLGAVYMESASTEMTDEATTANGDRTVFTITSTSKRLISLDPSDTPIVKYNNVAVTSGFTIDYGKGEIIFTTTPGASAVTISGKYITMTLVPGLTKFSVDTSVSVHDVTQFVALTDPNYGWKRIIGGLGEWSATADGFLANDDITNLVAVAVSVPKHFQFVFDQTNMSSFLYGQGSPNKSDVDDSVANVITQNISILSASKLYRKVV